MGPVLFNIFINELEEVADSTFVKFSGNTMLVGGVDNLNGRTVIQRDLDRWRELANRNFMKFSEDKWRVLHLEGKNRFQQYELEIDSLRSKFAEKEHRGAGIQTVS